MQDVALHITLQAYFATGIRVTIAFVCHLIKMSNSDVCGYIKYTCLR